MTNRRESALRLSCDPKNRANLAAKVDISGNWSLMMLHDFVRRSGGIQTKPNELSKIMFIRQPYGSGSSDVKLIVNKYV